MAALFFLRKTYVGADSGALSPSLSVVAVGSVLRYPVREMHDDYLHIAPVYDAVTARFLQKPRERIAAVCRENALMRVLDVGCGTGQLLQNLAGTVDLAVGMDMSDSMLLQARATAHSLQTNGHSLQVAAHPPRTNAHSLRTSEYPPRTTADNRGRAHLLQGNMECPPFLAHAPRSSVDAEYCFDAVVFSLVLHETRQPERLLEQAFTVAPRVIALEWRMPERNLDYLGAFWVPVIERLAGKEHYRRFRQFIHCGGLRGLAQRVDAELVYEEPLRGGSLVLAILQQ